MTRFPLKLMKKKAAATTAAVPFHQCTLWLTNNVLLNCKEGDFVIEVINSKRVHRWNGTAAGVAATFSFMNSKGILNEIWSFTR